MNVLTTTEVPACVKDAASRIAGTALGPFIMGQRNVDLEALEQRIVRQVISEMNHFGLIVLAGVAMTPHVVIEMGPKPRKPRNPKVQKTEAGQKKHGGLPTGKRKTVKK